MRFLKTSFAPRPVGSQPDSACAAAPPRAAAEPPIQGELSLTALKGRLGATFPPQAFPHPANRCLLLYINAPPRRNLKRGSPKNLQQKPAGARAGPEQGNPLLERG